MLEYLPPYIDHGVTLDGYEIPRVSARETDAGTMTHITFDRRFGIVIPAEYAAPVLSMIANAFAVGQGFSCHGENSIPINENKVKVREIGSRLPPSS